MAYKLLSRADVSQRLVDMGCTYVDDAPKGVGDAFYPCAYWRSRSGFLFTVPLMGYDECCTDIALNGIIEELRGRGDVS